MRWTKSLTVLQSHRFHRNPIKKEILWKLSNATKPYMFKTCSNALYMQTYAVYHNLQKILDSVQSLDVFQVSIIYHDARHIHACVKACKYILQQKYIDFVVYTFFTILFFHDISFKKDHEFERRRHDWGRKKVFSIVAQLFSNSGLTFQLLWPQI